MTLYSAIRIGRPSELSVHPVKLQTRRRLTTPTLHVYGSMADIKCLSQTGKFGIGFRSCYHVRNFMRPIRERPLDSVSAHFLIGYR